MPSRRPVRILAGLCVPLALAGSASAKPSFAKTNGNSCRDGCHTTVQTGRMEVVGEAGTLDLGVQLDGATRGPLKLFQVAPGNTVTMSMDVLNGDAVFAVQLKRLETPGQQNDLANFLMWAEDNLQANPWTRQENTNPPYFTKDDGNNGGLSGSQAGVFSFDLFVEATTPPDVYDLEFAVAGMTPGEDLYYQDEHFYLQVVPEPGSAASAAAMLATLACVRSARRRRSG